LPQSTQAGTMSTPPPINQPVVAEVRGYTPPPSEKKQDPPSKPVQVQIEAPFVFRGSDPPPADVAPAPAPPPATSPVTDAAPATKPASTRKAKKEKTPPTAKKPKAQPTTQPKPASQPATAPPKAQPNPQSADQPKPHTFFGKVKGFFRSIFR